MKKKTLRIILAGYGNLGEQLVRLLAAEPCCRVVAVADPGRRALEKATSLYQLSTFPNLDKALEATDADVVVINTPSLHAHDLAATALEHGLHVLVTKPMKETSRLTAVAKARRRTIGFTHDPVSARDYLRELEAVVLGKARAPASRESR